MLWIIHPLFAAFYVKAATGISAPETARIHAPRIAWDSSPNGYNGNLNSEFLLGAALGYDFPYFFSMEAATYYRYHLHYRHFQLGNVHTGPEFLGNRTRLFDLDIATLLLNFYFSGRGVPCLNWNFGIFPINLYPFVGFGAGGNQDTIYNFRTVGLSPIDPYTFPSTSSESPYTQRYSFAFQLFFGLEAKFCDMWALSGGYRWFSVGRFRGPEYLRDALGVARDIGDNGWRIDISANEFFLELKAFL